MSMQQWKQTVWTDGQSAMLNYAMMRDIIIYPLCTTDNYLCHFFDVYARFNTISILSNSTTILLKLLQNSEQANRKSPVICRC